MSSQMYDQMEEINKLQEEKFNKTKLQNLKNAYKPLFEALHIAKANFQCTYNANDSKFYQTSFHDLKLIHNEQNLDLFSGYINEAESCGLDVSALKKASETLQDLCTPSSENIKIESMDIYIQDNIINPVWDFQFKIDYPGSQETSIVSAQTSMFDIYTDCLNLIISSMDIPSISVLSGTCRVLLNNFQNILKEHASIQDRLVETHFKDIIDETVIPKTISHVIDALKQISYKKYRYKLLEQLGYRLMYLIRTEKDCIDILNLCPESYQFLQKKNLYSFLLYADGISYRPFGFKQHNLVQYLEIPKCEAGRQLFRELLDCSSLFVHWRGKSEDWINGFIEIFKDEIEEQFEPRWLSSLGEFPEKSAIVILQLIAKKLWDYTDLERSSFQPTIFDLLKVYPRNVSLEMIRILDDKLVKKMTILVNQNSGYLLALAIYMTHVDPENRINSKFIKNFNGSSFYKKIEFSWFVLKLLPVTLWKDVLKDKTITFEIFQLLPETLKSVVLVGNYNISSLNPLQVFPLLSLNQQCCLSSICRDSKEFSWILEKMHISQIIPFMESISDLKSKIGHLSHFQEILSKFSSDEANRLIKKYLPLFDKTALVYYETLQKFTGTDAPILRIYKILEYMTVVLDDSTKWDKLNLVRRWLEETEIFDSNLQDQVLLLTRDICAIKQGYFKLFAPDSLNLFYKLCGESNLTKLQIINLQYASVPTILESGDLEMRNIDSIPGLLNRIESFLKRFNPEEEWIVVDPKGGI